MIRLLPVCFLIMCLCQPLLAQHGDDNGNSKAQKWADSVYDAMSVEQRIGQLFMVAAYSNQDEGHKNYINNLVKDQHIGGLIFMQGSPVKQAQLTNYYQSTAKTPLLIGMDAEWGLSMRLDSTMCFPRQLTLGAIQDDQLIKKMGLEMARQLKRLGVHWSFSPVVDINNNPKNPVINDRSFGENKLKVSLKGLAYMEGLQEGGVMACAKHFPGHGDTDADSHKSLPLIKHSRQRLSEEELYPFRVLINNGLQSVMAAHLFIPSLDSTVNQATSLSKKVVTDLLKDSLGFKGLVVSDALNMKGVSAYFSGAELNVKAYQAGNDILLFANSIPESITAFKKGLKDQTIDSVNFERRIKKILLAKHKLGLDKLKPVVTEGLFEDLHQPDADLLKRSLHEASLTLVKDKENLVPLTTLNQRKVAIVSINGGTDNSFTETLGFYTPGHNYSISGKASRESFDGLIKQLAEYNTVIIGVHNMSKRASVNYGLNGEIIRLVKTLSKDKGVIVTVFGSPYSLKYFKDADCILAAYEENEVSQIMAAQAIFGATPISGTLPVSSGDVFREGMGIERVSINRLKQTLPEEIGLDSKSFLKVDSIAQQAIEIGATPGCQILVAKDGKIIYQKCFGYHTYDKKIAVKNSDIYDLASITKVAGTTIGLMQLYDERKFNLNRTLSDYLEGMDSCGLKGCNVKDVLSHQAGLFSWIPFYAKTIDGEEGLHWYSKIETGSYTIKVAENLYMHQNYVDSIYQRIYASGINDKQKYRTRIPSLNNPRELETVTRYKYRYSDLGFYLFKRIIEQLSEKPMDEYLDKTFYSKLGLPTMTYNPLTKFEKSRIIPTEEDKVFRKQVVHGYVHDPGAAMLGGVSGHAGLFSSSFDLAVLMQMLLNGGEYGGETYLSSRSIALFTRRHRLDYRRGIGFDKPETEESKPSAASKKGSPRSFGHSGFTGTCVWADPDEQLIYVFLSNRVYPDAGNRKLIAENVRTNIHDAIYEAIEKSKQEQKVP